MVLVMINRHNRNSSFRSYLVDNVFLKFQPYLKSLVIIRLFDSPRHDILLLTYAT